MSPKTVLHGKPRAIVITGTPGTGKTAVSKSLAKQIGANYLALTQFVIENQLGTSIDRRRKTKVVNLKRTRACLRKIFSCGKFITVVDTHVPDAVPREHVRKVIVLRCHPKVLEGRLRRKGWKDSKVRENLLAEILDSCYVTAEGYHGARKTVQLDTSRKTLSNSVSQARRAIMKGGIAQVQVDWIRVLHREHSLEKYLR